MKIQNKKQDDGKASQSNEEAIWKEKYLRALADYQNLEKRARQMREEESKYAAKEIIGRLLPVSDVLQKVDEVSTDEGIRLAVKLFADMLKNEGVEKINVVGEKFNPHTMECIEVVEGEDDVVKEEILPGYMIFERLLRPARVKVGKRKVEAGEKDTKQEGQNNDDVTH